MKQLLYIFNFMLLSNMVLAQNINVESKSIKSNFENKNIVAYQANSESKVKEFYQYLSLYSQQTDSKLKEQIKANIFSLVENPSIEMIDLTIENDSKISLQDLLHKIENQNIKFEVLSTQTSSDIAQNHWQMNYKIQVKKDDDKSSKELQQIIYFEPINKQFGSKSKTVWSIKLGAVL